MNARTIAFVPKEDPQAIVVLDSDENEENEESILPKKIRKGGTKERIPPLGGRKEKTPPLGGRKEKMPPLRGRKERMPPLGGMTERKGRGQIDPPLIYD